MKTNSHRLTQRRTHTKDSQTDSHRLSDSHTDTNLKLKTYNKRNGYL